ncbi:OmpA family protein [Chiayiivirga flava]|uniref:Outer membrane protein OmpA-like peptidoglycan-associated protein n=1 Tax=Chiayiivirga flava TaxID=659595 RepID=A0A7W8G1X1_9GAMM|nr:outer membrane protein OmpA-like peptidoglycan-associated protein [Chiayiivirga flava]
MNAFARAVFPLLSCLLPAVVLADATEPVDDIPAARDLPWLERFDGSVVVSFSQSAYDEYLFPGGPLKLVEGDNPRDENNNRLWQFAPHQTFEGARTRIVYVLPAGRSPLEALRGYQQVVEAMGGAKTYECKAGECGGDAGRNTDGGGGDQSVAMKLWPHSRVGDAAFSNGACAQTMGVSDQRLGSFAIPDKAYVVVHAFTGTDTLYCKAINGRTIAVVDVLELKPREEKMVTVSAADMGSAIASTGRVALYGILFDTNSSTIKPESTPALEQIAALMTQQPALKLHVVGHTDSQGGLESNFALSKARAQAVSAALTAQYGIAAARLSANGVSYLAPVASNADDAGRAKNRRVELVPF